jgi:DNA-binding Lrp family transcriptional regulator
MPIAFIQMVVEPGKEEGIKKQLGDLEYMSCKVEEAYLTYGEFDIVIKISGDTVESINHFVLKIRETEGIERTMTSLAIGSV